MGQDEPPTDPAEPSQRDIGREMVDDSTGLGTVVAHLYRGEVDRETSWRNRLDATTNWAVTIIAGILAYTFSASDVSHGIILVAMLIGVVFLGVEARRFQRYDIWRSRVRSMQENLFAVALDPTTDVEHRDWRRQLSRDYQSPEVHLSLLAALSHRLRRVYLPLQTGLLVVWLFRLSGSDEPIVRAASLESAPGWLVLALVVGGFVLLVALALAGPAGARSETDEQIDHGNLEDERRQQ